MNISLIACILSTLLLGAHPSGPNKVPDSEFLKRTQWWREAKFGMFIHWGIYAVPADTGEWEFSNKQMQVADYEKYAAQFNPVKFDAKKWVEMAKNAGMKYIVITSKHHDGFCMWGTKQTNYNIVDATPFQHDPMKDLADECQKQGIKLCFYHSIMDWHHLDYLPRRPWDARPVGNADLNHYIDYMKAELQELLTQYGPIGVIWFDGGWEHSAQELRAQEVVDMIRSLQPDILINDRINLPDDFTTPEQSIPGSADQSGRLWETCMTMNDHWGYVKDDQNWKSAQDLIRNLCDIASKGGNYLLNVGPTAEGEFPQGAMDRLAQLGDWMSANSSSIYATTASPFRQLSFDGRCTQKGNHLYLMVFNWPQTGLVVKGLQNLVTEARALNTGESLKFNRSTRNGITSLSIAKPSQLDPNATVIDVTLVDAPVVRDVPIDADENGIVTLNAIDASVHGTNARYEQGNGKDDIGYWTNSSDYVTWSCQLPKARRYRVLINYACDPGSSGSNYTVGTNSTALLSGTIKSTGSWTAFQTELLGEIDLPAGAQTIAVRVKTMPNGAVMNLHSITLVPNDVFTLNAIDASVHGTTARYEQGNGKDDIGYWINPSDYVTWNCAVSQPGDYRVQINYACPPENSGSAYTVGIDGGSIVNGIVNSTGSWIDFKSETLGYIRLPSGQQTIAVRVKTMPNGAVMNLHEIILTRVSTVPRSDP